MKNNDTPGLNPTKFILKLDKNSFCSNIPQGIIIELELDSIIIHKKTWWQKIRIVFGLPVKLLTAKIKQKDAIQSETEKSNGTN